MIRVLDDVGRDVRLAQPAQRVVSLVPSLTETLFALGCGDAMVGVTRYCTEPAGAVQRIERVGGTKNPDVERIIALQPDLVLLNAEENRREQFDVLERAGLTLFVSFPRRAQDVVALLPKLGELMGSGPTAAQLTTELNRTLTELSGSRRAPEALVFCPIWKNPWMSFNRDTYADDMLASAGGRNVCAGNAERYPVVTLDEVAAARPDVILLPDEPYVFGRKDLAAMESLTSTPAWRTNRVHFIDGKALSWYGVRTAAGLRYFRHLLDCRTDG